MKCVSGLLRHREALSDAEIEGDPVVERANHDGAPAARTFEPRFETRRSFLCGEQHRGPERWKGEGHATDVPGENFRECEIIDKGR